MQLSNQTVDDRNPESLRARALGRLSSSSLHALTRKSASEAMGVLHELAASPETAADALALLHELQVHQVELEVQAEELRKSRAEMEAQLGRHAQLYDFLPAGCFTIDRQMIIGNINWAGSRLFGQAIQEITGKSLADYLEPQSHQLLVELLKNLAAHDPVPVTLQLRTAAGNRKTLHTAVCADPAGGGALLALLDIS